MSTIVIIVARMLYCEISIKEIFAFSSSIVRQFSFVSASSSKMRYNIDQRKFIVKEYYKNEENLNIVGPLFQQHFGIPAPKKESMMAMVTKFDEKGTVHDQIKGVSGRYADMTCAENIERVRLEYTDNPRQSISRGSQILDISKSSVQRILKKKLLWKPYKTQVRHDLPERCVVPRKLLSESFLDAIDTVPDLLENIWFTDESHFELVPALNKQNHRHWGPTQPFITIERGLHPAKTTVWGAMSARGKTRSYSILSNYSLIVTVVTCRNIFNLL